MRYTKTMDILTALDTIPVATRCTTTDDIASGPVLEIHMLDVWVEVDEKTFTAWTGFRRKNGEEYHDIVIPLGANSPSDPVYTGARACLCPTCQSTVEPKLRAN
jgi:hypothetical protein